MPIEKVKPEMPPELTPHQRRIIDTAKAKLCGLLEEQAVAIFADGDEAFTESGAKKFKFPVSLKIVFIPQEGWGGTASIAWSTSKKYDCEFSGNEQPEIPGIGEPVKELMNQLGSTLKPGESMTLSGGSSGTSVTIKGR